MERRTEFNLNKALQKWRDGLRSQRSFTEENIEELQTHLLDQMDALKEKELSVEEAFLLSKFRLGESKELAGEFKRINTNLRWKERACWLAIGLVGYMFIYTIISALSFLYLSIAVKKGLSVEQFAWGDIAVKSIGLIVTTCTLFFIYKKLLKKMPFEKTTIISIGSLIVLLTAMYFIFPPGEASFRGGGEYIQTINISTLFMPYILMIAVLLFGLYSALSTIKEKRRQTI